MRWLRLLGVLAAGGALGLVALYLWYVRALGVRPQVVEAPGLRWTARAPLPRARTEVTAAVLGGRVYVIGGFDGCARTTATVQVYDPATDRWHLGPPLPHPVHHAMAAAASARLFVVGGLSGVRFAPSARVFAFDGGRWTEVAPLPEPLGAAGIAVVGGRIHVVGGVGRMGDVAAHYRYDPARDAWTRLAPLPVARDHLAAAALDGRLYAIGGRLGGNYARNLSRVDVYDPRTDRWQPGPALAIPRSGHTAAVVGGRLVVLGGEEPGRTIAPVELFDGRRWSAPTRLPTPRHGLGSAVVDRAVAALAGGPRPALSVSRAHEVLVLEE
ncbi:MAG: galactose oxidase [Armatimonadota bacterium]|nr:galactose oxidase [Armatimonadota bacterium]MDR7449661.1 galactose oxidase [Armatimonadota bacterium]MDR7460574.1 galactose oxidase [Armatimonadota bacterium]MDR7480808.1 galactose oxidase [Armatimonadota bacterium]MDR7489016.1 galactose oxidase [Armatimonadota bacterium]